MHLTRETVVFEVYNPYSIVQLSEVLRDMRVLRGDRTIYSGRAVVSSIVSTGVILIVSATLVDAWSDLVGIATGQPLRDEVQRFIHDWDQSHDIRPSYQIAVGNVSSFLSEVSRWLNQVETASGPGESPPVQREFTLELESGLDGKLGVLFGKFEHEASQIPPEEVAWHKAYVRRQVHPLMLVSPFIHRTYTKPLGYAGDYEMVNMILRDRLEGPSTYARLLNSMILRSDGAQAHRNRVDRLIEYLKAEVHRVAPEGRTLRVLNIGCGPAGEIQRFIRTEPLADRCEFHLMDFNAETLAYTQGQIEAASNESGRRPVVHYIHKSINELLKDAARGAAGREVTPFMSADLVYCAGLFDYLSDKVCKRLIQLFQTWVAPGGLVAATNVHPRNGVRYFLEHILEWNLVYRDEKQMDELAEEDSRKVVNTDPTGVNVFLEIRKPVRQAQDGPAV
jgi:extracellular factor (EF) 3-hydroxypalmitic acid methyl ester biosynthesis protein